MKLAVLWAVAACVAGLDLSCEEYCACLSSGYRDVEYQPGCDCTYELRDSEGYIDDSGIYYEPAAYVPLPAFISNHPFYIINPTPQLRERNSTNTRPRTINIQRTHTQQIFDPYEFRAEIEIDIDNAHSTHKRKEKDIQADHELSNRPLYLDIHIKAEESERSASANVFTAEALKQTEQSLLECAEVYALLNYRNRNNTKHLNTRELNHLFKYDHLSNSDLMKVIDDKCLHISNILQKSIKEIKENRPKKVNSSVSISKQYQENKELPQDTDILNTRLKADTTTGTNLQETVDFREESKTVSQNIEENEEYTYAIDTERESEQNDIKKYNTLPSQVTSNTIASTSNEDMPTLSDTNAQKGIEEVSMGDSDITTEKHPSFTSIYMANEYPLQTTNYLHTNAINRIELTTPSITNKEEDIIEHRRSNDNDMYNGNRKVYKEEDVSLAKVITHEFANDTVQSYINGTEVLPNDDFRNDEADDDYNPIMVKTKSTDTDRSEIPIESDIHGNLYFLVNKHQIPARFIQNPNGTLHLGIDALAICDKFKQDGKFVSKLFSALCKCYESDNCTNRQD